MFKKRINIFTGYFGSGKTEVSVNYALRMAEAGYKTAIADFDIVNPYFRTADVKDFLSDRGIWVVLPVYANTNVDVPALSGEVNALFQKKDYKVVLDVGGDDLGARAVSRYRNEIVQDDYELFFVINTKRPLTETADEICEVIASIENSARMKVTKLVNNTNLLSETHADIIREGFNIVREVSDRLNIPIAFTSGMRESLAGFRPEKGDILIMDKMIKLPWEE